MSISLAQLQATVDHAWATFCQEQQARKAEFENSSLRATEEYEKQFGGGGLQTSASSPIQ
jgi:hypothetical protein